MSVIAFNALGSGRMPSASEQYTRYRYKEKQ